MRQVDFIIVGQGIAGTMLAQMLRKKASIIVIDKGCGITASRQATGMINPITGRRFVKTWLIDELLPLAEKIYKTFAAVKKSHVIKVLHSIEQCNDFKVKAKDDKYARYLQGDIFHLDKAIINNPLGCIKISPVLQVDTALVLDKMRKILLTYNELLEEEFDFKTLIVEEDGLVYKDIRASKIIFCEGVKACQNPYFNYLPLTHAKGEVLYFEATDFKIDYVLNSYANITPLGGDLYSIGATYDWDDTSFSITQKSREELEDKLHKMIQCTYKIVDQKAGLRPTAIDRRPLVGFHPSYKNLYIFNGMGTKGLSLSPYFAQKLALHLTEGIEIPSEVDIKRFDK